MGAADETVGGGDAGHVGAVVAAGVVVRHGGVLINVVVRVGDLGSEIVCVPAVELAAQRSDLGLRHQLGGGAGQTHRIGERLSSEGLVRRIDTGVDDGDAAACAGVAGLPSIPRAHHVLTGVGGVGVVRLSHRRLIAVLQNHVLDAVDQADRGDIHVANLGGDGIDRQGHVPFHVQFAAQLLLDRCRDVGLLTAQTLTVVDRGAVGTHALHRVARVQCGGAVQEDGYTHFFVGRDGDWLFSRLLPVRDLAQLGYVQRAGIEILHFQFRSRSSRCGTAGSLNGPSCYHEGCGHGEYQQHGKESPKVFSHASFLLWSGWIWVCE